MENAKFGLFMFFFEIQSLSNRVIDVFTDHVVAEKVEVLNIK